MNRIKPFRIEVTPEQSIIVQDICKRNKVGVSENPPYTSKYLFGVNAVPEIAAILLGVPTMKLFQDNTNDKGLFDNFNTVHPELNAKLITFDEFVARYDGEEAIRFPEVAISEFRMEVTPEQNEKVQKVIFSNKNNYSWINGCTEIENTDKPCLVFDIEGDDLLPTLGYVEKCRKEDFDELEMPLITYDKFIELYDKEEVIPIESTEEIV